MGKEVQTLQDYKKSLAGKEVVNTTEVIAMIDGVLKDIGGEVSEPEQSNEPKGETDKGENPKDGEVSTEAKA